MTSTQSGSLEETLAAVRPRLVRALIAVRGVDGAEEAAAEAIAWAWEHRDRLADVRDVAAYLYRVAQTRSAPRKRPALPAVDPSRLPEVEPGLVPALLQLPEGQRGAVWLVVACGWKQVEAAEALGVTPSTVSTQVARGMASLRSALGVSEDTK